MRVCCAYSCYSHSMASVLPSRHSSCIQFSPPSLTECRQVTPCPASSALGTKAGTTLKTFFPTQMKLKGVEFHFCPSSKKGRLWRCPDLDTAFLCSIYGIMPPMLETIDTPTRRHKAQLALLGCCLSVFWNGCIAFGFPGVMGSY